MTTPSPPPVKQNMLLTTINSSRVKHIIQAVSSIHQ